MFAKSVVLFSWLANIKKEDFALESASRVLSLVDGIKQMKESNLELYLAEMALIKEFLEQGVLDEADYMIAEAYLAKKHCINDKSIYRLNKLINDQDYGMYIGEEKEDKNDSNKEDRIVTKIT